MDSLDAVELIIRFEKEFAIEIPNEDCERIKTVRNIYDYLNKRLETKP